MKGEISLHDIARIIQEETGEKHASILAHLRAGCRNVKENQAVVDFAEQLKTNHIPLGLVTANFDVFNEVIVPEHGYGELFDVIVNSCDYGEMDKRMLWPIAFRRLGKRIGYANSLLIEDGKKEPQQFRDAGGYTIEYSDDVTFIQEISRFRIANNLLQATS